MKALFKEATMLALKSVFVTDSKYVVKNYNKTMDGGAPTSHRDLWDQIRAIVGGREVVVNKIESHLYDATRIQVEPWMLLANELVDIWKTLSVTQTHKTHS